MTAQPASSLSDWPAVPLRQPLPIPVRPVSDETIQSYLMRLGQANAMHPYYFADYVTGSSRKSPALAEAVITLSGLRASSVRYAILELCTPDELASMNVAGRPRPGHCQQVTRCSLCAAARGATDAVICWTRDEDIVCLSHARWTTRTTAQVSLAGHDDIIRANKLHRRLIRHRGRAAAQHAFSQASSIITGADRGTYAQRVSERLRRFHGAEARILADHPTVLASCYPSAVALAMILASPYWTRLAFDPAGNAAFVAEVRRTVEPQYTWNPVPYWRYVEPLARTLLDEAAVSDEMARAAEYLRQQNLRPWPGSTFGWDELRQDQRGRHGQRS